MRKQHFIRFRLITLLFTISVICIYLGYFTHRNKQHQLATELVLSLHGQINYENSWDESYLNLWELGSPSIFPLSTSRNPFVDFSYTLIGKNGPSEVVAVSLDSTDVSDEDLEQLASFRYLQALGLGDTSISDSGILHLLRISSLKALRLNGTQITEEGLTKLRKAMPKCAIYFEPTIWLNSSPTPIRVEQPTIDLWPESNLTNGDLVFPNSE